MTAIPPIAAPSPSEPVSPMKIEAGQALNQRNPTDAPTRQAERRARPSCPVVKVMAVYASSTIAHDPAARPSRPSVRFTAFDAPAMTLSTGNAEIQDLSLLCACFVGAAVGFLWFNSFPASIFMGDTGSLGLGGAIAGMAVMTKTEVLLIILGGIFVIEALSVAIQVFSFQRFRKRVFLMAPVHHHFELQAWSETKIILRFWIVASVCSAIGFTLYQQSVG